jgi:hypothetical protein
MVRKFNGETLEQFDKPARENHWRRERKAKIDFFDESPFAIDRQLEDQREQMKFNRNPQLTSLMRSDQVRSTMMFESKGEDGGGGVEDAAEIKAKVVNKIVRQYSGRDDNYIV